MFGHLLNETDYADLSRDLLSWVICQRQSVASTDARE